MTTTTTAPAGPPGTRATRDARRTLSRRLRGPQDRNLWFWVFVGPFVLGLLVFVYLPIAWSLLLSFFDARNTVTPTTFVGLGNYADMLSDAAFRSSLLTFVVFAAFIVPTTFALSLGVALLVNRARFARTFFRSVFFLPTACSYVVAALVWKMSIFIGRALRPGQHGAGPARHRARRLAVGVPTAVVLAGDRQRPPVAAGRVLHDPVPRRRCSASHRRSTRRPRSTGHRAGRCCATSRCRSCARRRRPCCCCCSSTPSRRSTSSTTCSRARAQYPPYARPPLVYLYYTALGQGQDFGHGSAGAVILTLLIAVIALAQGRFLRLGQRED